LWCLENCWKATCHCFGVWRIAGTQHVIVVTCVFWYDYFLSHYSYVGELVIWAVRWTYPLNARCESMYISSGMKLRGTINAICDTLRICDRCVLSSKNERNG
jgi:hypothetical protein